MKKMKANSKRKVEDLAICGGSPSFSEPLHVGRPNLPDRRRFNDRMDALWERRWLTNQGPYVREFERKVAEYLHVKHCIAICNATIALEIAIRAAGLTGEVIIPSFTFVATAHSLQWQEITPVFCDIDPVSYNIDPLKVEAMVTPRTTGIIGVHLWGRPCAIDALEQVARRCNLKLLFDAAHAFGCSYREKMIGNFGEAEIFSFHATKFINTFEGGMVATNNDALAEKVRLMKNFGFSGYDNVIYIGTNGKMMEMAAAMGLTGLESLEVFLKRNHENFNAYRNELQNVPGITLIEYDDGEKNNYQYIVAEIHESNTSISRDQLIDVLHAENILARRYFYPGCHQMEPYRSYFPHAHLLLPETERLTRRVLLLPTGMAVNRKEIKKICKIIHLAIKSGDKIKKILNKRQ